MIVYREWDGSRKVGSRAEMLVCSGWFLFGIIPLYIRKKLV